MPLTRIFNLFKSPMNLSRHIFPKMHCNNILFVVENWGEQPTVRIAPLMDIGNNSGDLSRIWTNMIGRGGARLKFLRHGDQIKTNINWANIIAGFYKNIWRLNLNYWVYLFVMGERLLYRWRLEIRVRIIMRDFWIIAMFGKYIPEI